MTPRPRIRSFRSLLRSALPPAVALLALAVVRPAAAQLSTAGSQIFQQGAGGVPGAADGDERFGSALATGDFDGDGRDDLAIGVPRENVAPASDAGVVTVLYGADAGLDGATAWAFGITGFGPLTAGSGDLFGAALAIGDFNGDGFDDLAVGVPGRLVQLADLSIADGAGAVLVLYGHAGGIQGGGAHYFHQESTGIEGVAEANDRFGSALAAGDFDGDGYDDLAIGVPQEDVGELEDEGAVNVIYGSDSGLDAAGDQIWTAEEIAAGSDEIDDRFGAALAAGDFDGDGFDDLAIGAPDKNIPLFALADAGAVYQLDGGAAGLAADSGAPYLTQEALSVGASETSDWFGASLAAGDLDGDGIDDLLVGSPGEGLELDDSEFVDLGQAQIVFGEAGVGASAARSETLSRFDFAGQLDVSDRTGTAVAIGNFDGGAGLDLALGAALVDVGDLQDAGEVYVGSGPAFDPPSAIGSFGQEGALPGVAETGDRFGEALAVGDFDGDGFDDLAVGVPFEAVGAIPSAGAVNVLYSAGLFRDDFERGDPAAWSDAVGN